MWDPICPYGYGYAEAPFAASDRYPVTAGVGMACKERIICEAGAR